MDDFDELAKDPAKLFGHVTDLINEMYQTLTDDEEFCQRDLNETGNYIEKMEAKITEKFQQLKEQLDKLRNENRTKSEENRNKLDDQTEQINELFTKGNYREAWKIFKDYEKNFDQRLTIIKDIPKLHMNEADIERYFSLDPSPPPPPPTQAGSTLPVSIKSIEQEDDIDDTPMTAKQEQRKKKQIDNVVMSQDNEEMNTEKTEQTIDNSRFGIRSNPVGNQPTIATATPAVRTFRFSNRLPPSNDDTSILPRLASFNSFAPISQRTSVRLTFNPICHYQHDRNKILLMACTYQYIVLFKSQRNRLDRWELGAIERGSQSEIELDWHDGLIISMGCLRNDRIYMFTEREFAIYSILERRKLHLRILPRGNDDEVEYTHSSVEYQRGIGTVDGKYWYHIYSNRSSHWTLSTNSFENNLAHVSDLDLTLQFPDVSRFIHLSVNEKIFHFLVQMYDFTYAVVSYSKQERFPAITLTGAQQPLSIYSAYHPTLKETLCFINDPLIDILHITTASRYVQSYPTTAYAISLAEKNELLLVRNDSIQSININQINFVSD